MNHVHENNSRPTAGAKMGPTRSGPTQLVGTPVAIVASNFSTWQRSGSRPDTSLSKHQSKEVSVTCGRPRRSNEPGPTPWLWAPHVLAATWPHISILVYWIDPVLWWCPEKLRINRARNRYDSLLEYWSVSSEVFWDHVNTQKQWKDWRKGFFILLANSSRELYLIRKRFAICQNDTKERNFDWDFKCHTNHKFIKEIRKRSHNCATTKKIYF